MDAGLEWWVLEGSVSVVDQASERWVALDGLYETCHEGLVMCGQTVVGQNACTTVSACVTATLDA